MTEQDPLAIATGGCGDAMGVCSWRAEMGAKYNDDQGVMYVYALSCYALDIDRPTDLFLCKIRSYSRLGSRWVTIWSTVVVVSRNALAGEKG